ncbi:MAG: lysoplasmalogenase [Clostridia bacterium]|nr:lysoplasmalogenase [Clostridia bacterium]
MNISKKAMFAVNGFIIASIFVLNYFYQIRGFDFVLKCVCSGAFALLGLINLAYALVTKQMNKRFYIGMASGLVLAMLGDVILGYSFIFGAAVFALGHICFVVSYCYLQKLKRLDYIISGVLFIGAASFLLFCPLLNFEEPIFRAVCVVYALIISVMLGKAVGNFIRERNAVTGIIASASILFFFSDLMLVLDWFIGFWDFTDHACMGTYYPALCFLAFSMFVKASSIFDKNDIYTI